MDNYIGKVKLNYTFYKGEDKYSDGEIEDEMLDFLRNGADLDEVLKSDDRWPILYHFSPNRHNLLDWYPFGSNDDVLEIGSGCGALTGLLASKAGTVTCVELSQKRSLINAYRCSEKRNLEIIVGNLNDIDFQKTYDYVTLIGVLEYSALYTPNTNSPYISFLKKIKGLLKNQGKLIIAIENKLGLKYWAGSREDHTGDFFDGIQNYPNRPGIRTFSKMELKELLNESGFKKTDFYYPYPDYKLPSQIYTDWRLPSFGELKSEQVNYDRSKLLLFDENAAADTIIKNELFPEFSNSFLVICS